MSAKNCDNHNRWRNITVGFRVSPEENEQLNRAVAMSGLPKQEYCYRKCMDNSITVTPNPRIFKAENRTGRCTDRAETHQRRNPAQR